MCKKIIAMIETQRKMITLFETQNKLLIDRDLIAFRNTQNYEQRLLDEFELRRSAVLNSQEHTKNCSAELRSEWLDVFHKVDVLNNKKYSLLEKEKMLKDRVMGYIKGAVDKLSVGSVSIYDKAGKFKRSSVSLVNSKV